MEKGKCYNIYFIIEKPMDTSEQENPQSIQQISEVTGVSYDVAVNALKVSLNPSTMFVLVIFYQGVWDSCVFSFLCFQIAWNNPAQNCTVNDILQSIHIMYIVKFEY